MSIVRERTRLSLLLATAVFAGAWLPSPGLMAHDGLDDSPLADQIASAIQEADDSFADRLARLLDSTCLRLDANRSGDIDVRVYSDPAICEREDPESQLVPTVLPSAHLDAFLATKQDVCAPLHLPSAVAALAGDQHKPHMARYGIVRDNVDLRFHAKRDVAVRFCNPP